MRTIEFPRLLKRERTADVRTPNITGTVTGLDYGSGGWTGGAFNVLKLYPGTTISSESCAGQSSFMASRSSSVYGKSSTVQPSALRLIPCIKI